MSLLLLSDKLTVEDISKEIKVEEEVVLEQLTQLDIKNLISIDRTTQKELYSINEIYLAEIVEFVRQFSPE